MTFDITKFLILLIKFFFFLFAYFYAICRKARRKEKDGDQNSNDTKLYLEESVLERKLTDANLNTIIELPAGLDYNEWLASHSKCPVCPINILSNFASARPKLNFPFSGYLFSLQHWPYSST